MTPRKRFISALEGKQVKGRVPHFESVFTVETFTLYIGVHPESKSQGIYACRFNADEGRLSTPQSMVEAVRTLFHVFSPSGGFLYAVGHCGLSGGGKNENVCAFSISAKTGKLKFLNQVPSCGGTPCHITIDKTGKYALVANYTGGTVAVFLIRKDGFLSEASCIIKHDSSVHLSRQECPHPHSIILDVGNRFAFVSDLGLDKIMIYRFSVERGILEPHFPSSVSLKSCSGPRHFIFHPEGRYAFSINELSNTITVFQYDSKRGVLAEIQAISMVPNNWKGTTYASEIQAHPNGRYIYGANRGHDSIAVFEFVAKKGILRLIEIRPCGGHWPDHFCIDPTGQWLLVANRLSNNVAVFRIDAGSGKLIHAECCIEVPSPSNIQFHKKP